MTATLAAWSEAVMDGEATAATLPCKPFPKALFNAGGTPTMKTMKDNTMRAILSAALIAALAVGTPVGPAQAAGCIKGAIAGGLAGHVVGHGVLGAAGGCFAGRSIANRSARQQQSGQQNLQNGNQDYTSGTVRAPGSYGPGASQSQGYAPGSPGQAYGGRTTQQGPSFPQGVPQN